MHEKIDASIHMYPERVLESYAEREKRTNVTIKSVQMSP